MIGISLEDLEMVHEVLLFCSGIEKMPSIKVLLEKGFVDHLIIDSKIADGLVQ